MSSRDMVYLDYAATTPVEPAVAETLAGLLRHDDDFANPSAIHIAGRRASEHLDRAASQVSSLLNCRPDELVWTSGATESDNLAIAGAARYRADRGTCRARPWPKGRPPSPAP